MGFFDKFKLSKLREGLQKSHDEFVRKINRVFYQSRKIDDELMAEIEETLILSDVGVATTERIVAHLEHEIQFKKWSEASELRDELRAQISEAFARSAALAPDEEPFTIPSDKKPYVIL